ncbi:diacylglycerol kinase family protein [Phyllobacterium sp. A18/5-2]|uniref:diacylglycerol/lipid kinase family protein n=1 Tax=Phyllobacterium sp. A18/5-2 TaxID=2978392 RepID=UPI0021C72C72|nr:diacylglycerol kinase family protein [Phyllobacterium sp. A18/5-2]UXN64279.1 diacylglycerol kinase family protein [Phyllobacterium sp. A18/5-2]
MKVHAVFNRDGGTFRTMDMTLFSETARTIFEKHGHTFESEVVAGKDIIKALKNVAAEAGEHVLMAGGGDGTISAAADVAWKAGVPLAVLPAGTMNLFARALKIPLELNAALESLAGGTIQAVDISTANEESFVHQFSIGFQPQIIKLRNTLEFRSRWGKRLASLRAFAKVMGNPPQFDVSLNIDGVPIEANGFGDLNRQQSLWPRHAAGARGCQSRRAWRLYCGPVDACWPDETGVHGADGIVAQQSRCR